MLILLASHSLQQAALGCAVVLAGWPVYRWIRHTEK
jgi:hypothetical protein